MRRLALLLCLAGPALADSPARTVEADLDGDGVPESYALVGGEDGVADLRVEGPDGARTFPDVAWAGPAEYQAPVLELRDSGSLAIVSTNDEGCRNVWVLTLTVAWRDGALRVAGATLEWCDAASPEAPARCDLNLLTGRGVVETAQGREEVRAGPAPRLDAWRVAADGSMPALLDACWRR